MTRYELLDRIGVGGMAEIFRGKAVAAGGFEKPVAIKRILPHLSQDKRFVELLIAEAKVLSLLKHRNIVQIFDVGLGDDAQYFLVMEFVDGKDLGAVQRTQEAVKKRLPYDLALHIGAEVCEALEHAHSARAPDGKTMSLVHRDVSPSNVLLSRAGEVKLTDFGIAKRAEAEQTGHGAVRGKFAYISPEQARNEHIEPRSDVFSVGILLWEMVTGRRLFSGLGDLEALRAVREAQVQRPRAADPQLSSEIDALIMSALARDPKRRPTAGQLGEKLRSIRYSLEITGGDPATELAKIIDTAEARERESHDSLSGFDVVGTTGGRLAARTGASGFEDVGGTEATMIHIRTAAEFAIGDSSSESIKAARQVIDRFEEEETRLAQLSGDQLRMLRDVPTRDSSEMAAPPMPAGRSRRATDEPTTARPPIDEDAMTRTGAAPRPGSPIPHLGFDGDEATRLVAPTNRRTPAPERIKRAGTVPPPVPLPGVTVPARPPLPGLSNAQAQRARNLSAPPPPSALGAGPPPMPNLNAPPPMPADARPLEDPSHHSFVPGTVHSRNPSTVPPPTAARALPPHL